MNRTYDPTAETPETVTTRRRMAAWAENCAAGARDPFDGLTSCERKVLEALRALNYELASERGYGRYIRKAA